jgi:hypothetical protein
METLIEALNVGGDEVCVWLIRWDLLNSFFYSLNFLHVHFILFFLSFSSHVCYSLWGLKRDIKTKGGGKLYFCEERMEWKMKGCVKSFFIVWFCVDFLDAMRIFGIRPTLHQESKSKFNSNWTFLLVHSLKLTLRALH